MALTTEAYGPTDRNPDRTRGEWQIAHLIGDGTAVVVAAGAGELGPILNNVNIAGSCSFHDAVQGAALDATNRIVRIDTASIIAKTDESYAFRQGLQVVTTAATNDVTFGFYGRATLNPRTFGA
jgi:hypothetical protein